MGNSNYIYLGEKYLKLIVNLFFAGSFFFIDCNKSNIIFAFALILVLFGLFFRIFSIDRKVLIEETYPEYFFKSTRHPYEFGLILQLITIILILWNLNVTIIISIFFLFLFIEVIIKSEEFYSKRFSGFNVYKTKVPVFFPRLNMKLQDFMKRENKEIPVVSISDLLYNLIPFILIFQFRFGFREDLFQLIKDLIL
jgi:protein-S-isoprenylcysteine O-methyltransferase Ste14